MSDIPEQIKKPVYIRKVSAKKPKVKYSYFHENNGKVGGKINDNKTIRKLSDIKVPHSYTNVQLYPHPTNKLQATGFDGNSQKQYFYSEKHREDSEKEKYCTLISFYKVLPKIMSKISSLLGKSRIDLETMHAIALKVMLICNFRIGNEENLKKYDTYGLSTITTKEVKINSSKTNATIKFVGKKQQVNECTITDKNLVGFLSRLVDYHRKSCDCKAGQHTLFKYSSGQVTGQSLNEFLQKYDEDISTKTLRTWFANVKFIESMNKHSGLTKAGAGSQTEKNKIVKEIIDQGAKDLHHTSSIHKKSYLHPALPSLFMDNTSSWMSLKKKHKTPEGFLMDILHKECKK